MKENKNEEDKFDKAYIYVYGSPVHLRQIFLNIYGNCIKYTQVGGMITTSVSKIEEHDNICIYRPSAHAKKVVNLEALLDGTPVTVDVDAHLLFVGVFIKYSAEGLHGTDL